MKKAFLNFKAFILSQKSKTPNEIGKILLREAIQISSAESCTGEK
jgi:nicotinamide mononucleotide (NMN) deamidase PncC